MNKPHVGSHLFCKQRRSLHCRLGSGGEIRRAQNATAGYVRENELVWVVANIQYINRYAAHSYSSVRLS
jgi:hypothetical protein